jgi:hypothetical protein
MKIKVILSSILLLALTSCGAIPNVTPIEVTSAPTERLKLTLPDIDAVTQKEVSWVLITEENYEEVFAELKETGEPVVFFALTDTGYANISINYQNARQIIQQQQAIIAAYENYYVNVDTAEVK